MNKRMPEVTPAGGALGAALAALVAHYIATGEGTAAIIGVAASLAVLEAVIRYARNAYTHAEATESDADAVYGDDEGDDTPDPLEDL